MQKTQFLLLPSIALLATGIGIATAQPNQNNDSGVDNNYQLITYKNCQQLERQPLNAEQVAAYQALQQAEQAMENISLPNRAFEEKVTKLGKEIEEIAQMAVQRSQGKVIIDEQLMAKQQAKAKQIDALLDNHQEHFDALNQHASRVGNAASRVGNAASRFEQAIAPLTDDQSNITYRVIKSGESASAPCFAKH